MYFQLERVTEPDIEVLTLEELRRHLRLFEDINDDDDDLEDLIVAAREWAEQFTGRALIEQQWRLTLASSSLFGVIGDIVSGFTGVGVNNGTYTWNGGGVALRRSPVLAIVSVGSLGTDGTETAVAAANYEVRGAASKYPELMMLNTISLGTSATRIVFRAGYADRLGSPQQGAEMVPRRFKQAMKLWAEAHYDRDAVMMKQLVDAAERIIRPERCHVPLA